jgi:hypothetical protein
MKKLDENRFCVYVFKDLTGIFYIGSGSKDRSRLIGSRPEYIRDRLIKNSYEILYLAENISKAEALRIENDFLYAYFSNGIDGWSLLNKQKKAIRVDYTYDKLKNVFDYDESSPTFLRWKIDIFGTGKAKIVKAGDVAGRVSKTYSYVCFNYQSYCAHRVIYSLIHKIDIPNNMVIDHINGDKRDNRIDNLQLVTQQENICRRSNSWIQSNNKTGVKGVNLHRLPHGDYWYASIHDRASGKRLQKYFRISTYGEAEAFRLACAWRKSMEEKHYN